MLSENDSSQQIRVEALLFKQRKLIKQQLFLYAFVATNFNFSEACRLIGVKKATMDYWVDNDKDFKDIIEEMHWHKSNFFESALIGLVKSGDSAATIFANKTFNRERGYGEIHKHEIKGEITHTVETVDVDALDLPLETRKQLLEALQKKEAEQKLLEQKANSIDAEFEVKTEVA
jgi:hypothetical protein